MELPLNRFKAGLMSRQHQLGIWNAIGGQVAPEILAGAGFDWMVVDTEHAPLEVTGALPALQILAAYPDTSPVVRPAINDSTLIKRHLDQGAQTLIVPYVESAAEAESAVSAMRYPPKGMRGVAGTMRASRYGRVANYATRAAEELCLIVQVETRAALDNLEEIASVDGVDGVFIGPSDLSASLGFLGQAGHPEVVSTIKGTIDRLKAINVPAGILSLDHAFAKQCMEWGTAFTAVGLDSSLLAKASTVLRESFA